MRRAGTTAAFSALAIALGLLACALLPVLATPPSSAWADEGICGYAYLDPIDGSDKYSLVIRKNLREEQSGYRYLGPVPNVASNPSAQLLTQDLGPCPWNKSEDVRDRIQRVVIEGGGENRVAPISTKGWFFRCGNLVDVDFSGLDTSSTIDFSHMFELCGQLQSFDISQLDFSSAENLSWMFSRCFSLESANLSGVSLPRVVNMEAMFAHCDSLKSADLSELTAENVETLGQMFQGCPALVEADFSSASVPAARTTTCMFINCGSLVSASFSDARLSNLTNVDWMFENCGSLISVDFARADVPRTCSVRGVFYDCALLDHVSLPWSDCTSAVCMFYNCASLREIEFPQGDLFFGDMGSMFEGCFSLTDFDLTNVSASVGINLGDEDWGSAGRAFCYCGLRKITIGTRFDNGEVLAGLFESHADWFVAGSEITCSTPEAMLNYVECAGRPVTFEARSDPSGIFAYVEADGSTLVICQERQRLKSGEVEVGFAHGNYVPWMPIKYRIKRIRIASTIKPDVVNGWFGQCRVLEAIDGLENVDTSNVVDMSDMFFECKSLSSLDVSHFDTSKVNNMNTMFHGCVSLKSLDLEGFNTSNVTDFSRMFSECNLLSSLDVSSLDTSNATGMKEMFRNCWSLESLDVTGFDTSKVVDMGGMFDGCASVKNLDVSGFVLTGMSDVARFCAMFQDCSSLLSVEMFDVGAPIVLDARSMFQNCYSLTSIDLSGLRAERSLGWDEGFWRVYAGAVNSEGISDDVKGACFEGLFLGCSSLSRVKVSNGLKVIPQLPDGMWRPADGGQLYRYDDIPGGVDATYELASNEPCLYASVRGDHLSIGVEYPVDGTGELYYLPEAGCAAEDIPWRDRASEIKTASVGAGVHPQSTAYWFEGCSALETVDLSGLDSSQTSDFSSMFRGCSALGSLDLSGLDTRSATLMKRMFHGCRSLSRVALGADFTFRGAAWSRLAGSELPAGAWQEIGPDGAPLDASRAWAADSLPSFTAADYARVEEAPGLTVTSLRGDAVDAAKRYTIETTYGSDGEDGGLVAESSYVLDEGYDPSVPLVVGGSAKAASAGARTVSDSQVSGQSLKRVVGNVSSVVLGPKVSSVSASAFAAAPSVTKLRVESSRLTTWTRVYGCLRGSNVKAITYKAGLGKVQSAFKSYAWKK